MISSAGGGGHGAVGPGEVEAAGGGGSPSEPTTYASCNHCASIVHRLPDRLRRAYRRDSAPTEVSGRPDMRASTWNDVAAILASWTRSGNRTPCDTLYVSPSWSPSHRQDNQMERFTVMNITVPVSFNERDEDTCNAFVQVGFTTSGDGSSDNIERVSLWIAKDRVPNAPADCQYHLQITRDNAKLLANELHRWSNTPTG